MTECNLLKRRLFSLLGAAVFTAVILSCASTPDKVVGGNVTSEYEGEPEEKTAIQISNPDNKRNKNYTYFSRIDQSIMTEVEIGSPSSLRKAASSLRKIDTSDDESSKVLLAVEANIMQIVWPQERVDWESPSVNTETPYLGAIKSAKNGIYDVSTGNVDFLAILLPSLVILKVNDVRPFYQDSEKALLKCISMRNNSVLANYLLGQLYYKASEKNKALQYFKNAQKDAPDCFQTVYSYAECLYQTGNLSEAKNQTELLNSKYPLNTEALKLSSKISYDSGNYDYAEECISRVLQQQPNDLDAVLFRARILIQKKDFIHAASLLDVYSRQDSSSKRYLLLRAQVQYDWSKNVTAAVSTIENALKSYPGDTEVLLFAAKLCSQTGVSVAGKNVEDFANAVLEKNPSDVNALKYAVEGLIIKKKWTEAYDMSLSLLSKNSSRQNVFNHIKICLALKKYDEAWNLIQPLYRNNSADEEVVQNYIRIMVESGKNQQAMSLINQLMPSASSKQKSYFYYLRSFLQSQEETCLSDLRSSLIANPRNSDSLFRLYEIYYGKRDYRKAQYYLKQVVALNPNDAELKSLNEKLSSLIK